MHQVQEPYHTLSNAKRTWATQTELVTQDASSVTAAHDWHQAGGSEQGRYPG